MNVRPLRRARFVLAALPGLLLVPVIVVASGGCEVAVNLDPGIVDAGARSDVLDCGICADVSVDADYDALGDVSIYGASPGDGGRDGTVHDAGGDGPRAHDAADGGG